MPRRQFPGSSNGRMADSESARLGSNPSPGEMFDTNRNASPAPPWDQDLAHILALSDESPINIVSVAKGRVRILPPIDADEVRATQRRYQPPPAARPPTIQVLLKQAHELQARLDSDPNLKRAELAKEIGVNPSYLTRVLHLLSLAPAIRDYILQMRPSIYPGPITENRIRFLARHPDHGYQIKEFDRLKNMRPRVRYPHKPPLVPQLELA